MSTPTTGAALVTTSPAMSWTSPIWTWPPAVTVRRRAEPLEGLPGREFRIVPLQATLDLIEPALVILGERHGSFSRPEPRLHDNVMSGHPQ